MALSSPQARKPPRSLPLSGPVSRVPVSVTFGFELCILARLIAPAYSFSLFCLVRLVCRFPRPRDPPPIYLSNRRSRTLLFTAVGRIVIVYSFFYSLCFFSVCSSCSPLRTFSLERSSTTHLIPSHPISFQSSTIPHVSLHDLRRRARATRLDGVRFRLQS